MNTTELLGTAELKPTPTNFKRVTLRGACGKGFGQGQLLARVHRTDRTKPIVVERAFLPNTIDNTQMTKPFAWQTRPFKVEPEIAQDWTHVIVEVAVDAVSDPRMRFEYLDGCRMLTAWEKLDLSLFQLDDVTMARMAVLTGLMYKNRKFKSLVRGSSLKNFMDADELDAISQDDKNAVRSVRVRHPAEPNSGYVREIRDASHSPNNRGGRSHGRRNHSAPPTPFNRGLSAGLKGLKL